MTGTAADLDAILARHHASLEQDAAGRWELSYFLKLPDGRTSPVPFRVVLHSKRREVALEAAAAILAGAETVPPPGPFSIQ